MHALNYFEVIFVARFLMLSNSVNILLEMESADIQKIELVTRPSLWYPVLSHKEIHLVQDVHFSQPKALQMGQMAMFIIFNHK